MNKILDLMPPVLVGWVIDSVRRKPPEWISIILGTDEPWNLAVFLAVLGVVIFVLVIFIILIANRTISKTIKFVGLGRLDSIFGLFFGFIRSYIICVCLFTAIDIVYNYNKWPINIDKSYTFPYIEKGSNYLVKEFPNEKSYQNSKEKIEDI